MEGIDQLVSKALEKKENKNIDRDFARELVEEAVQENGELYDSVKEKAFNERSKEFKSLIKAIRRKIRDVYGVFFKTILSEKKREAFIERAEEDEVLEEVMEYHLSTSERLDDYPFLYEAFEEFFGTVSSFGDIGCGYNPLSTIYFDDVTTIRFSDISKVENEFVERLLDRRGVDVKSAVIDVSDDKGIMRASDLVEGVDICFLFKVLDSVESKNRGKSEFIIKTLMAAVKKGIIVSFSNRTISGKNLITSERQWFQNILDELDYEVKPVGTLNEDYYLLKK